MFGIGKNKVEVKDTSGHLELTEKISKMNLSDMRIYVNNKLKNFEVSEDGLSEVMNRLISKDAKGNRFIETDAMDSKIKKALDLVIVIASNKKVTVLITEQIQQFIELYSDIIFEFDTANKQIYGSKLKDSLLGSVATIASMAEINRKAKVLGK